MTFLFGRLGRYFAVRFLKALFVVFAAVSLLAFTLDLFELLRRAGDANAVKTSTLVLLAALRLPFVLDQVLPFAVLFGAIAAFLGLSRRLELVIARSAGISAWQFISPTLVLAVLLGGIATVALNPLVSALKDRAEQMESSIFGKRSVASQKAGFWFRQRSGDGDAVIRADRLQGNEVINATAFLFDPQGHFTGRMEAASGSLSPGQWSFKDVEVVSPGARVTKHAEFILPTSITATDLDALSARDPNASFWSLPGLINRLELAGLSATRYRLMLQSLYSKPLLFAAMVLIAASVSLRFFRMGGVAQLVGIGILGGFALYVLNQIGQDLGSAGLVPVIAAAWTPAVVGVLAATQALLRSEDG
jgi:lipopolysaccharide export system permease protein